MICWNEAQTIDLSLKSLKGFVDEVIIADTGSFDGTQDIARSQFEELDLSGEVIEVRATTIGRARHASWERCDGAWILLLDSNQVLSEALKHELKFMMNKTPMDNRVKSYNLMGDYHHYFEVLPFHNYHPMFFMKKLMRWGEMLDRPRKRRKVRRRKLRRWAVNLSRVRPAWRVWYRGEPFDPKYFKPEKKLGHRHKASTMDMWMAEDKYPSAVEYVEATQGLKLEDVKRIAPEWYLNQLREYARKISGDTVELLPEVIKEERKKPRYKLVYGKGGITGRWPQL